jgi:hypothetical protein
MCIAHFVSVQENEEETEFAWEDFSEAELDTFLRILKTEETDHEQQVSACVGLAPVNCRRSVARRFNYA